MLVAGVVERVVLVLAVVETVVVGLVVVVAGAVVVLITGQRPLAILTSSIAMSPKRDAPLIPAKANYKTQTRNA